MGSLSFSRGIKEEISMKIDTFFTGLDHTHQNHWKHAEDKESMQQQLTPPCHLLLQLWRREQGK